MYYAHEEQERKLNAYPMCTSLPAQDIIQTNMRAYLLGRKLSNKLARANGWYESRNAGDPHIRVVIPAVTHKANHVYWQARSVLRSTFVRYQSPKGPRHEALIRVFPFGTPKGIVVVEGPMCALAAAGEGYIGYALMGMQPSKATLMHLALLIEDNNDLRTLVLLDRGEMANGIKILAFLSTQGYSAKIAELPEKDLAACDPTKRKSFLSQKFSSLFKQKNS